MNGFFLANYALVQLGFHTQQFLALALKHSRHWNTGPVRNDLGNFFVSHFIAQQSGRSCRLTSIGLDQLFFEFWNTAVLQF